MLKCADDSDVYEVTARGRAWVDALCRTPFPAPADPAPAADEMLAIANSWKFGNTVPVIAEQYKRAPHDIRTALRSELGPNWRDYWNTVTPTWGRISPRSEDAWRQRATNGAQRTRLIASKLGSIEWDSQLVVAVEDRGYCVVVHHIALDNLPAEVAQALRFHEEEQC
jgi:hypothetical protein